MLIAQDGALSADDVWERYSRPAHWPAWAPQITRVQTDVDVIRPGTRGRVHGPLFTWVPFRIRSVDHDSRRWSWWVGFGVLGVCMDHGVDETPGGSRAWVRIHAHRYLVFGYVPVARFALRRLVAPDSRGREEERP